ncbi:uncharacterized protein BDZ99DRAFT_297281 [Mytilinidion resinicola]|uniref:Uncharacterized protein n=1 Tax=Mytilinidion resinicola TaxID=574789 RepID=A0A6A6YQY3_9PEZI|nr:uncharacterized protein BDZ99DRAFT_297281 [Mytilinidion resinicola]KAF2811171.1 hypothetical protein BDZ99DRAFT_297281 [Mytilinidion resinicola]
MAMSLRYQRSRSNHLSFLRCYIFVYSFHLPPHHFSRKMSKIKAPPTPSTNKATMSDWDELFEHSGDDERKQVQEKKAEISGVDPGQKLRTTLYEFLYAKIENPLNSDGAVVKRICDAIPFSFRDFMRALLIVIGVLSTVCQSWLCYEHFTLKSDIVVKPKVAEALSPEFNLYKFMRAHYELMELSTMHDEAFASEMVVKPEVPEDLFLGVEAYAHIVQKAKMIDEASANENVDEPEVPEDLSLEAEAYAHIVQTAKMIDEASANENVDEPEVPEDLLRGCNLKKLMWAHRSKIWRTNDEAFASENVVKPKVPENLSPGLKAYIHVVQMAKMIDEASANEKVNHVTINPTPSDGTSSTSRAPIASTPSPQPERRVIECPTLMQCDGSSEECSECFSNRIEYIKRVATWLIDRVNF